MRVLIVALEEGRWGVARLPRALKAAGFEVAALCPKGTPIAETAYLDETFRWLRAKAMPVLTAGLIKAVLSWRPHLLIPADEPSVAVLHALGRADQRLLPLAVRDVLRRSMGAPETYDAALLKHRTLDVAKACGIAIPPGDAVSSLVEAEAVASRVGFPVMVKDSYGWSGDGVRLCTGEPRLREAFAALWRPPESKVRRSLRGALGRAWYPRPDKIGIQRCIDGEPAYITATAFEGVMLAAFAGVPLRTAGRTGPSTVVTLGPHAEMAAAAQRMIAALGFTGFIGFDFMIERSTGRALLLECNPRPNQVAHLGARIGVDLCGALSDALHGQVAPAPRLAVRSELITLFPQEWSRSPVSADLAARHHDVPWDDPGLLAFAVDRTRRGWAQGAAKAVPDAPPACAHGVLLVAAGHSR